MSWNNAAYCSTTSPPPSDCILWGVAWEQLILAGAIFLVTVPPARFIMYLIMGAFLSVLPNLPDAKKKVRTDYFPWAVRIWRWGFTWLTYQQLFVPANSTANTILLLLITIPFCVVLLISCDVFMQCVAKFVMLLVQAGGPAGSTAMPVSWLRAKTYPGVLAESRQTQGSQTGAVHA
jgi:hypothetical protein